MSDITANFQGPAGQAATIWQPNPRVTLDGTGMAVMPLDDTANNPRLQLVETPPAAGRTIAVEWGQLGAPTNGYAISTLNISRASNPSNYYVQMFQSGGKLLWQAYAFGGAKQAIDYDATKHKYWRVRFADSVYFEASGDGATWLVLGSLPLPSWLGENCIYTLSAGPWDPRGNSTTPNLLAAFSTRKTEPGALTFNTSEVFSADSLWRRPLPPDAPIDTANQRWARNLCMQMDCDPDTPQTQAKVNQYTGAQPGNAWFNMDAGGSPLYVVGPDVPTQKVHLIPPGTASDGDLQTSWNAVPIPEPITVGNSGDKSVCIWQPSTDTMWEFWVFEPAVGPDYKYTARWGGTLRNASTSIGVYQNIPVAFGTRTQWSNWGHTAASFPINGGAIQPEELDRGRIGHALHMVPGWTAKQFIPPAQRGDGSDVWWKRTDGSIGTWRSGAVQVPYPDHVPEGARLRFPADLDSSVYKGLTKMLVEAIRDYGMIITDKTGVGCGIRFRESSTYKAVGLPNPWTGVPNRVTDWPHVFMWGMPWHKLQVIDYTKTF